MKVGHLPIVVTIAIFVLLAGCGGGTQGYGVVLWPPEDSGLDYAMFVELTDSNDIEETYTVEAPETGERITVPQWRVEVFGSEDRAREFKSSYDEYARTFASAERQALPVRSEQDRTSQIVYRLREGEEVKVVSRSEQPSNEAGFVDYWYEVLTRDGSRGWAFGYYLSGVGGTEAGRSGQDGVLDDPLMQQFLSTTWRPAYFARMIDSGRIDLERFRPEYGLFPDPENNELRLNLPEHTGTFEYEGWTRGRDREFMARGTQFSVLVRRARDSISVRYTIDGDGYNIAMQSINRDIQEIRDREEERRDALYDSLRSRGTQLVSDAYGSIVLREDKAFSWSGFSRLVPAIIPRQAGSNGHIRFDHFLSESLAEEYDGALSFRFAGVEDEPVVFLYSYVSGGVRMAHAPPETIEQKLVETESLSPVIIFFSFEEAESSEEGDGE